MNGTNGTNGTAVRALTLADQKTVDMTGFTRDQLDVIRTAIAPGATDAELFTFARNCARWGLDPFSRQIYALRVYDPETRGKRLVAHVGIDGWRLIAERTGKYMGRVGPQWCGPDGQWRDVWLDDDPPAAARVGVLKQGNAEPTWAVARYKSFVQKMQDGKPLGNWSKMPEHMLAIRAESMALKAAFPAETAGLEYGDGPPAVREIPFEQRLQAEELYPPEVALSHSYAMDDDGVVSEIWEADNGAVVDVTPVPDTSSPRISDVQMKQLHAAGRERGYDHEALKEWARNVYGVESTKDLSMRQAAAMIQEVKGAPVRKQEGGTGK